MLLNAPHINPHPAFLSPIPIAPRKQLRECAPRRPRGSVRTPCICRHTAPRQPPNNNSSRNRSSRNRGTNKRNVYAVDARWLLRDLRADRHDSLHALTAALLAFVRRHASRFPVVLVLGRFDTGQDHMLQPLLPWVRELCDALCVAFIHHPSDHTRDLFASLARRASDSGFRTLVVSEDLVLPAELAFHDVPVFFPCADGSLRAASSKANFRSRDMYDAQGKFACETISAVDDVLLSGSCVAGQSYESTLRDSPLSPKDTTQTARNVAALGAPATALPPSPLFGICDNLPVSTDWTDMRRRVVRRSHLVRILDRYTDFCESKSASAFHIRHGDRQLASRSPAFTDERIQIRLDKGVERHPQAPSEAGLCATSTPLRQRTLAIEGASDKQLHALLCSPCRQIGLVPTFTTNGERHHKLTGISIAVSSGKHAFVDLQSRGHVPISLANILKSSLVEKRGILLKHLYKLLLSEYSVSMNGSLFDVQVALDLLGVEDEVPNGILAQNVLKGQRGRQRPDSHRSRVHFFTNEYSSDDSPYVAASLLEFSAHLEQALKREGLWQVASRIEFPLIRVLGDMEESGMPADRADLVQFRSRCEAWLSKIERKVQQMLSTGDHRSAYKAELVERLSEEWFARHYAGMGRPRGAESSHTMRRRCLERIAIDKDEKPEHRALASLFLRHEEVTRLVSRHVVLLLNEIDPDGRVRTTFDQTSSATGRLSSRNPNLQNVPVRSKLGQELRRTFRSREGKCIMSADYSQIELRIVASLSGDPFMLGCFSVGADIHRSIAGKIFGVPVSHVTSNQRTKAKQIVYSIIYGVSARGLSERLNVPVRQAENFLLDFKTEFPAVQEVADRLVNDAFERGYAQTLLGRRLRLPMLAGSGGASSNRVARRRAVNMPIQGTQADMIKISMNQIHERLAEMNAKSKLVLQIHDELILEVDDSECVAVGSMVQEEMISALPLSGVDVVVQIHWGPSWSSSEAASFRLIGLTQ